MQQRPSNSLNSEPVVTGTPTPENLLNLSLAHYQVFQYRECIDAALQALKLRPDYAAAYDNISAAYNALGNFAEGKKAAEHALRIEPDNQLAKNNLACSIRELAKK
jgi:tetratricopeptide (TPR) repeat protein